MAVHSFSKQYEYESAKRLQSGVNDTMRTTALIKGEALKYAQEQREKEMKLAAGIISENSAMAEEAYGIIGANLSSSPQERAEIFQRQMPEKYASDAARWGEVCSAIETMYGSHATEYFKLPESKRGAMSFDSYLVGQEEKYRVAEKKQKAAKWTKISTAMSSLGESLGPGYDFKGSFSGNNKDINRLVAFNAGATEEEVSEFLSSEEGKKYVDDWIFNRDYLLKEELKKDNIERGFAIIDDHLGYDRKKGLISEQGELYKFGTDSRGFSEDDFEDFINSITSDQKLVERLSGFMPQEDVQTCLSRYVEENRPSLLFAGREIGRKANGTKLMLSKRDALISSASAPIEGGENFSKELKKIQDMAYADYPTFSALGTDPVENLLLPAVSALSTKFAEAQVDAYGMAIVDADDVSEIVDSLVEDIEKNFGEEDLSQYREKQADGTYKYKGAFGDALEELKSSTQAYADEHNSENQEYIKMVNSDLKKQMDTGVLPTVQELVYAFNINTFPDIKNADEYSYLWTSFLDAKSYRDNLANYSNINDSARQALVSSVKQAVAGLESGTPEVGYLYGNAYLKTDEDSIIAGNEGREFDYDAELQKNIDINSSKIFKEFNPNGGDIKDSQMSVYEPKAFKEWLTSIGKEKAGGYELFQLASLWNGEFDAAKKKAEEQKKDKSSSEKAAKEKMKSDACVFIESLIKAGKNEEAKNFLVASDRTGLLLDGESKSLYELTGLNSETVDIYKDFKNFIKGQLASFTPGKNKKHGNMEMVNGMPLAFVQFFARNEDQIKKALESRRQEDLDAIFDSFIGETAKVREDMMATEIEASLQKREIELMSGYFADDPETLARIVMHGDGSAYDAESLSRHRLSSPATAVWYCGNRTYDQLNVILDKNEASAEDRLSEMNEVLAHYFGYQSYEAVDNDFARSLIQMNRECAIYEHSKAKTLEKLIDPEGRKNLKYAEMDGRQGLYDPGTSVFYEIAEISPSIQRRTEGNIGLAGRTTVQKGGLLVTGYRVTNDSSSTQALTNGDVGYILSSNDIERDADDNLVIGTWTPVYGGGRYQLQAYQEMLDATYKERYSIFEEEVNKRIKRDRDKKRSEIEKELYRTNRDIVPVELWGALSDGEDRTLQNKYNKFLSMEDDPETFGFLNSIQDPRYEFFEQYLSEN